MVSKWPSNTVAVESVINKEEMNKMLSDNTINKNEAEKIIKFIENSITPLPKKLIAIVEKLKETKTESLQLEESTKDELLNLTKSVEVIKLKWGFEELKQNFESSEIAKEFFDLIESYIDLKLDKNFSNSEKDKIKLALLWEIESGFNMQAIWKWLLNKVLKPLNAKIEGLKSGNFDGTTNVSDIPWMSEIEDSMTEMFDDFWLDLKIKELNEKIEKINVEKESGEITDLESVLNIINPENASNISFETIKAKTTNIINILEPWRNIANSIDKWLDKVPFWLGWMIKDWIKNTIKEGWILGMILWFFFWKEFMDESWNNMKESLKNLENFSKSDDFPLNNNIEWEDIEKLESKKLEKFHKFVNSKEGVESSSDTFWQELLTWNSKNTEIIKLHELLVNEDWKILEKDEDLDVLVDKLNNLESLERKKSEEEENNKINELDTKVQTLSSKPIIQKTTSNNSSKNEENSSKNIWKMPNVWEMKKQIDLARIELKKLPQTEGTKKELIELDKIIEQNPDLKNIYEIEAERIKIKQKQDFEKSVNNFKKLWGNIIYKWENLKLDIVNNQIELWKNKYSISIIALKKEKFEKIEFINWDFILNRNEKWEWTKITKNQVKELIITLRNEKDFIHNWSVENPISSYLADINYKLTIKKA